MMREWIRLALRDDHNATAYTLAATFLCVVPAGGLGTILVCLYANGWL